MTSGWRMLTSGEWRARPRCRFLIAWIALAGFALLNIIVNAASILDERQRSGMPIEAWEAWTWEGSSAAVWLGLAPLIFIAARRLRPPGFPVWAIIPLHLLLTVPASFAHVSLMIAVRKLVYLAVGASYAPHWPVGDMLLYEYRKDVVSYVLIAMFFLLFERLSRAAAEPKPAEEQVCLEVKDGSRTRWVAPGEIEWAQAAGNYVELHGRFGTLLHRRTLAALEEMLTPLGFVRVHRSRIVRAAAVAAIESKASGDFELLLANGARIAGSRRYREGLTERLATRRLT